MPLLDIVVATWNRDTGEKQMELNTQRLKGLTTALSACEPHFSRILKPQQAIKGIFVAPEYYFAAEHAGKVSMDGTFNERCVSETIKDHIVQEVPTQFDAWNDVMAGGTQAIMRNTAFVFLNGRICFKYNKANDFHESLSDNGRLIFSPGHKSGYTTIAGIDIGLEICLDHAVGRLIATPLPLSGTPHLHIVTSASVPPQTVVLRTNGYYIHASATDEWGLVQKMTLAGWADAEELDVLMIDGDPLRIYKIQLDVP